MNVTTKRSMTIGRTLAGAAALTLVSGLFAGATAETALAPRDAAPSAMQQEQSEGYSQYQEARRALNRAEYARAAELLEQYRQRQSDGDYVPESLYWQAFALSRMENTTGLRTALDLLRTQLDQSRSELETIRERGYSFNLQENLEGLNAVGVPVKGQNGVIGALSISGPSHRLKGDRLKSALPDLLMGEANELELNISYA